MASTKLERDAAWRAIQLRRATGVEIRRLREDSGLTRAAVAREAGIDPSYLTLLEAGEREAGWAVLAAIGATLGADLSVRLYPNTGPRIHDRFQAPMVEALLRVLHPRWTATPEVPVLRPARGVIDLVLTAPDPPIAVATEVQSELRRLEQQLRWHREKELSLPSADLWRFISPEGAPSTSRLLALRSTATTREIARTFEATLRATYPATTNDVVRALTERDAPWSGPGIVWLRLAGGQAELLDSPPRGVGLGR